MEHSRAREGRRRLEGVDVARALAMIGMLMVHVGPTRLESVAGQWYALPHGRASVLFMLVAGVGISFLAASRRVAAEGLAGQLLWRALLLFPLGLALQAMQDELNVILQTYALFFVLSIGLVRLHTSVLLLIGLVAFTLGPPLYLYGQMLDPDTFQRVGIGPNNPPGVMLHALVFSGPYPLVTWIVPFLVGLWLGRCDLRSDVLRLRILLVGALVAGVAWGLHVVLFAWWGEPGGGLRWADLADMKAHSQRPLWLLNATGVAVAVLAVSLVAADRLGRALWPLVATGQLALTFYVLHLVVIALWRDELVFKQEVGPALLVAGAFTGLFMLFAVGWRRLFRKGPLESLLVVPWTWRRSAKTGSG